MKTTSTTVNLRGIEPQLMNLSLAIVIWHWCAFYFNNQPFIVCGTILMKRIIWCWWKDTSWTSIYCVRHHFHEDKKKSKGWKGRTTPTNHLLCVAPIDVGPENTVCKAYWTCLNERNLTFNLLDPNQIRLTLCYTNCKSHTCCVFSLKHGWYAM